MQGMPIPAIGKTRKLHQEQLHRVVKRFKETKRIEGINEMDDREQQGLRNIVKMKNHRNRFISIR